MGRGPQIDQNRDPEGGLLFILGLTGPRCFDETCSLLTRGSLNKTQIDLNSLLQSIPSPVLTFRHCKVSSFQPICSQSNRNFPANSCNDIKSSIMDLLEALLQLHNLSTSSTQTTIDHPTCSAGKFCRDYLWASILHIRQLLLLSCSHLSSR